MAKTAVELSGVIKRFGDDVVAVDGIELSIDDGEFFSLLGPSGCGKTTTLRMIAGFEFPTEGSIRVHGNEMGLKPPNERPINTVFQSYALFPHMTVAENVAFGLQMKKVDEVRDRRQGEAGTRSSAAGEEGGRQAESALRWDAAEGRAGPGVGQRTGSPPPRRASGCSRPQVAPGDAGRVERPPVAGWHHLHLRHP